MPSDLANLPGLGGLEQSGMISPWIEGSRKNHLKMSANNVKFLLRES